MQSTLDLKIFNKTLKCKAILVPNEQIHKYLKYKNYLNPRLSISKQIPQSPLHQNHKYVILKPDIKQSELEELAVKVGESKKIETIDYDVQYGFSEMSL